MISGDAVQIDRSSEGRWLVSPPGFGCGGLVESAYVGSQCHSRLVG